MIYILCGYRFLRKTDKFSTAHEVYSYIGVLKHLLLASPHVVRTSSLMGRRVARVTTAIYRRRRCATSR